MRQLDFYEPIPFDENNDLFFQLRYFSCDWNTNKIHYVYSWIDKNGFPVKNWCVRLFPGKLKNNRL